MALGLDTSATYDSGSNNTITQRTQSYTCSGANRLLVLTVASYYDITATYAGVSLTQLIKVHTGDRQLYVLYLVNPASGANDLVVNQSSAEHLGFVVASFTGVSRGNPVGVNNTNSGYGSGSSASSSITTDVANAWVICSGMHNSSGSLTAGQTQIAQMYQSYVGWRLGLERQSTTTVGSYNSSWSFGGSYHYDIAAFQINPATTETITFQPDPTTGKDAHTNHWPANDNTNYNTTVVQCGGWADMDTGYLEFDLTGLPEADITESASIQVYIVNSGTNTTEVTFSRVTSSWTETGITYNTRPSSTDSYSIGTPTQGAWKTIDITTLYKNWKNGTYTNYGVSFTPVSYGNNNRANFYSSDYTDDTSLRPKLVIVSYVNSNIKVINGLASSSVKTSNGLAKASVKGVNSLQ
jgi:hypothetical protein